MYIGLKLDLIYEYIIKRVMLKQFEKNNHLLFDTLLTVYEK